MALAPHRPHRRTLARGALRNPGLLLVGCTLASCLDRNEMFTGTWAAVDTLIAEGFVVGRPELSLGHFGKALTGVARYLDSDGLAREDCPCAFVDYQLVDLEAQSFRATTTQCDGATWIWSLTLVEGDAERLFLEGTIALASSDEAPVAIQLVRVDDFVTDDRKECDP
jgi:hypothetical protein